MHFFYFDETKFDEKESPFFFIGGLVLRDKDLHTHEATLAQIQQNFFGTSILTQQTEMTGGKSSTAKHTSKAASLKSGSN